MKEPYSYSPAMKATLIGYARCSTDSQDLAAQKQALENLGVIPDRVYTDQGLTGTNRTRPGLDKAIAAPPSKNRKLTNLRVNAWTI